MTGIFVVRGAILVRFKENGRMRELQVPLTGDEMLALAGYLLSTAAQMALSQPQPQPAVGVDARQNDAARAWEN